MNYLKVRLWGQEIGRIVWDDKRRQSYFLFNPDKEIDIPDISPLLAPAKRRNLLLPIYGDERPKYQSLPPFISDSLPDSWGNTVFQQWVKENKIPNNKVTPLYKLMFIGTRGMGALEFEPSAQDLTHTQNLDIKALYDLSLKVLEDKEDVVISPHEKLTLHSLLSVGTSAGGRQMKAIIAIDKVTGEIRSGQNDKLTGFDYYILKFGDPSMSLAEIEQTYYKMAIAAGIEMEECQLFRVEGVNHFLTRRFDRKNGEKVHMQTLAAINPEADSYEVLIATCRELEISESEIEQIYRRMVFNILANNTDDHYKNFSFLLEKNGRWHISPAYDMTFTFNSMGTGPNQIRLMSINTKRCEISKEDLLDFAKENDIKNANSIIADVAESLRSFNQLAELYYIRQPWRGIIQKTITNNLMALGLGESPSITETNFIDSYGRSIQNVSISVNSKGFYELSANIDGNRKRRFIRPKMNEYNLLGQMDINQIPLETLHNLIESLLPPEIINKQGFKL